MNMFLKWASLGDMGEECNLTLGNIYPRRCVHRNILHLPGSPPPIYNPGKMYKLINKSNLSAPNTGSNPKTMQSWTVLPVSI